MKRYLSIVLILLLSCGLLLGGCTGNAGNQQEEQQQQEEVVQQEQVEVQTLTGAFQGLADGHSAEIIVDGEPQVYQFFDEVVTSAFETMDSGTQLQFDVEINQETGVQTIVAVYDAPAQG